MGESEPGGGGLESQRKWVKVCHRVGWREGSGGWSHRGVNGGRGL